MRDPYEDDDLSMLDDEMDEVPEEIEGPENPAPSVPKPEDPIIPDEPDKPPDVLDSILLSTKKQLGLPREQDCFDTDIIICINSSFFTLNQLGVGPEKAFSIQDENSLWSDFIGIDDYGAVKTYIYLKAKLIFDTPQTSFVIDAYERLIKEIEWRLQVKSEGGKEDGSDKHPDINVGDDSGIDVEKPTTRRS